MGTRSHMHFGYVDEETGKFQYVATIYVHWDGYPDARVPETLKFFEDVLKQCPRDARFNDASFLSAKYIVYKALVLPSRDKKETLGEVNGRPILYGGRHTNNGHHFGFAKPLDFLSIGIVETGSRDDVWIEWEYFIVCKDVSGLCTEKPKLYWTQGGEPDFEGPEGGPVYVDDDYERGPVHQKPEEVKA